MATMAVQCLLLLCSLMLMTVSGALYERRVPLPGSLSHPDREMILKSVASRWGPAGCGIGGSTGGGPPRNR
ncbi:guanylate-binding protein 5 [Anopheles sinensis]|uniref:Guanylate-binding protein 5 n=1 Tax=Anopheles sinensis TaxID=74873 RepID=A0A084VHJ6_ANOSI|nr:guanylate-binding protein 5 [Anopheles sinensis]